MEKNNKTQENFLYFEWSIIDQCNLNCPYCIVKGYKSQRKWPSTYHAGNEIKIANKIKELSTLSREIHINLTGGEPTLATHFEESMEILFSIPNAHVSIVTNLYFPTKLDPFIEKFDKITVSTHLQNRTDQEAENLIKNIQCFAPRIKQKKGPMAFEFNVVDYQLTERDAHYLNQIWVHTGTDSIKRLKYIHPIYDSLHGLVSKEDINYIPQKIKLLGNPNPQDYTKKQWDNFQEEKKKFIVERNKKTALYRYLYEQIEQKSSSDQNNLGINSQSYHSISDNSFGQISHMAKQNLLRTFGKRCAFGSFIVLIDPDAMMYFDVCPSEKNKPPINLLYLDTNNFYEHIRPDMKKCNHEFCHCNYNYFVYELYLKAALEKGLHYNDVFPFDGLFMVYDDQ